MSHALAAVPQPEPTNVVPFDRAQRRPTLSEIRAEIDDLRDKAHQAQHRAAEAAEAARSARRALLTVVK